MTDARGLIMGTSSPAMAFNYRGDKIVGRITTEPKAVQQTVYDPRNPTSKELAFWPSGDPKMQVIFQVETGWRNYEGINRPDNTKPDNGVRTIYLKGKHMERATADAIRAAGVDWLEVGGMISFEYIGDDMTSLAGVKPKLFTVRYQAPQGQPPAHMAQQPQAYGNQGYAPQQPPRPPQPVAQPVQDWQQPGWTPATHHAQVNPQQGYPQAVVPPMTQDPWATPAPVAPPHHGTSASMPDWAQASPSSAPPASPSSAPPAPHLSTLDMIKQSGQAGMPGFDTDEAGF